MGEDTHRLDSERIDQRIPLIKCEGLDTHATFS